MEKQAILLLEDGTIFRGISVGASVERVGELCFNTGMTGYQELFTDPSYYGQILVMTACHIGDYGVVASEAESDNPQIFGMVCREFSEKESRHKADGNLSDYLNNAQIPAIKNIDTRQLVRHLRQKGSMNAILSTQTENIEELNAKLKAAPSMKGLELASVVSTKEPYELGNPNAKYRIAVYDYGCKRNILDCFLERDCALKVFPAKTDLEEVLKWKPDGIFLSNGPGDPAPMEYAVRNLQKILDKNIPVFGICLGNQLLALAAGAKTYKLHYGHRGLNHPVLHISTQKSEITSQNHGFGVDEESLKSIENVEITHINLNDQTIEGIKLKNKPAFSVQYHPESSPGPHDSRYLFDDFLGLLGK